MSQFRVRATGEVKSQGQIRKDNARMSLPRVWNSNVHAELGIDPVLPSDPPKATSDYKVVVRNGIEQNENGEWVYAWAEQDMFPDYTDENGVVHTTAEQEAAHEAKLDAEQAQSIRNQRDYKIRQTDYLALSDNTLTTEMATYRQSLRDITDHANFPYLQDADWPTKPE